MSKSKKFDLYTFVAGSALERGELFQLRCNCGGVVTIMPPFQEPSVVCSVCESSIKILVIDGDAGYIIGRDQSGDPMLLPVQGSSAKPLEEMSSKEQQAILENVRRQVETQGGKHGGAK